MSKFRQRRGRIIDLRKGSGNRRAGEREALVLPLAALRPKTSLRARRRKLRALRVLVLCAAFAGLAWGVSALSYSPKFAIQGIAVVGAKEVPASLVRAYVETKLYDGTNPLLSRGNIFLYPRAEIEKSVTGYFPRIRTAEIARGALLAQAITVTVAERTPFALWCSGALSSDSGTNDCYVMDDSGFVFAPAVSPFSGSMVFGGGLSLSSSPIGETYLPTHLANVLLLLERFRQAAFAPESVFAENEQDFSVQFKEGFELRASWGDYANVLVRNLQLALSSEPLRGKESKLEYIDLRFGNRVYYKIRQ